MTWRRTLALCAAIVVLPSIAHAQAGPTARVRYLAGYTHDTPEIFGSNHDWWTGVVPEVSYLFLEPRWTLRATYAFTAAVHTRNPTEIANRVSLLSSFELSRRTNLLFSADANQTSLSNYLVTRPVTEATTTVLLPPSNSRFLTLLAGQGLTWEASPNVLLGQGVEATYVTSIDPQTTINNVFVGALLSLERTWKRDAVGGELRAAYAGVDTPPTASGKFMTVTAAPRWRHDWSESFSSTIAAGGSVVFSPTSNTDTLFTPSVRAALLYTIQEGSYVELSYLGGVTPNVLTGQLFRSHLVGVRGGTPLSERHRVFATGSVGFLNGRIIDLRDETLGPEFNGLVSDVDVSWLATDWMQLFARGVFQAQDNGPDLPAFVREAVLVGLQFSTRSPDGVVIPVRFPQRVDRSDASAGR